MRPTCPKCRREMSVTTTRADAGLRTQYFGCRACGLHSGGPPNVITMADASRTKIAVKGLKVGGNNT